MVEHPSKADIERRCGRQKSRF